jgi:hypothetical protein
MNSRPAQSQRFISLGRWCWQSRGGFATLLAGLAILVLSAVIGYQDHAEADGVSWIELASYLCAVVVVATQAGRLVSACARLAQRPTQWLRSRSSKAKEQPSR